MRSWSKFISAAIYRSASRNIVYKADNIRKKRMATDIPIISSNLDHDQQIAYADREVSETLLAHSETDIIIFDQDVAQIQLFSFYIDLFFSLIIDN